MARLATWVLAYGMTLGLALLLAFGIRIQAMNALYTHEVPEGVYLSVVEISEADLAAVADITGSAPDVQKAVAGKTHLINYVLPTEMYVSEIPMFLPPGEMFGHTVPGGRDPAHYKVIVTEAVFDEEGLPKGGNILRHAVHKRPLWEAHVDLSTGQVTQSLPPPANPIYGSHQVPLF